MPQIYGFALGRGYTARILYRLRNLGCCYQIFPNNLDLYLKMLIHDQPEYVLGWGASKNSGWGDLAGRRINELIEQKKLQAKYAFIVIPKIMKFSEAVLKIDKMLGRVKLKYEIVGPQ